MKTIVTTLCYLALVSALQADSLWTGNPTADAFVATGSAANPLGTDLTGNNYGGAGTLAIAPASSTKGEFQSLLKFDLSGAKTQFDSLYGAGLWQFTSITLTLASNFGTQGAQPNNQIFNAINAGSFTIEWLSDDTWSEGTGNPSSPTQNGVLFDSLSGLLSSSHQVLGTYLYTPPGNNVPLTWTLNLNSAFLSDAATGGNLSFLIYAADNNASYLFNSRSFGSNRPLLSVSAIPEPNGLLLLGLGLGFVSLLPRRR